MKYLPLVIRNLLRNRRRSFLTIGALAVSIMTFSIVSTFPTIFHKYMKASASSVRVACHNKAGLFYPLPAAYKSRLLSTPHVKAASGLVFFGGVYRAPSERLRDLAVDAEQIELIWPDWGIHRRDADEFRRLRTACLVSPDTLRKYGWRLGKQIILRGTIYPIDLTLQIVGIAETAPPSSVLFRRDYLEELLKSPALINAFWVRADRPEFVSLVIGELNESFDNANEQVECEAESAFVTSMTAGIGPLFTILQGIGLVVVLTMALVAANTAAITFRERRGEIAVLRALGFSPALLGALFVAEFTIVGVIGGALGAFAADAGVRTVLAAALGLFGGVSIPVRVRVEAMVISVMIGILSGAVQAIASMRGSVVEVLRRVN